MKKLNNKGFTLVELLAVIVILAIIMAIAATMVLPIIDEARQGSFASTAMVIVDAAEQFYAVQYLSADHKSCYTIAELVDSGYLESVDPYDTSGTTATGQYDGVVLLNSDDNLWYVYLNDHTNGYVIASGDGLDSTTSGYVSYGTNNTGTIDSGDVLIEGDLVEGSTTSTVAYATNVCP